MATLGTAIKSQYGTCSLVFIKVKEIVDLEVKTSDFKNLLINQRPKINAHVENIKRDLAQASPDALFFTELKHISVKVKKTPKLGDDVHIVDVVDALKTAHIIDGQHSISSIKALAMENPEWLEHELMLMIYFNLTHEQEIQLFLNINGQRRTPSPCVIDLVMAERYASSMEVQDEKRAAYALMAHRLAVGCRAMIGRVKQPFHNKPQIGIQFHAMVVGIKEASKVAGVDLLSMPEGEQHYVLSSCWNSIYQSTDDLIFGENWKRIGHSAMFVTMLAGALAAYKQLQDVPARELTKALCEKAGPGYRAFLADPRALSARFKNLGGSLNRSALIRTHIEIINKVF